MEIDSVDDLIRQFDEVETPDDRVDVDLCGDRVDVHAGNGTVEVYGFDDPVDVHAVENRVDVDPGRDAVHVDPHGDPIEVHVATYQFGEVHLDDEGIDHLSDDHLERRTRDHDGRSERAFTQRDNIFGAPLQHTADHRDTHRKRVGRAGRSQQSVQQWSTGHARASFTRRD